MKDSPMKPIATPQGTTSVSHDGREYPVVSGTVSVPDEAVAVLIDSHGFTLSHPAKKSKSHGSK